MVRVVLRRFGSIEGSDIDYIMKTLEECYLRFDPHEVSYLDLYLFENTASMKAFFNLERLEVGVTLGSFEDVFIAQHDAWRGVPRISICLDRLRSLPKEVRIGSIRHEVGHSVLHGSIEYYVTPQLMMPGLASRLSEKSAGSFMYLVSIAVKDFEVARSLFERGYAEDQVAYAMNILDTTDDDLLAWRISRGNRFAETLCLISRFKEVCYAAPFLGSERYRSELEDRIVQNLSYLGSANTKKLLEIATGDLPKLGVDTIKNINLLSHLLLETFMGV